MLKDSLYHITAVTHQDGQIQATLELDEHHAIFAGHFPDQPVLPGACMLQMVKEVLEDVLNTNLQLTKAANLKFIQPIDPQKNKLIELGLKYVLDDNKVQVNGQMLSGGAVCFKYQGEFVIRY